MRAIWYILVAKNSCVMISDFGLTVVNSRARRHLIPWEKILGLVQRDYLGAFWERGWLMVRLQDGVDGRERMTIARYYCRRPAAMDELRDEIIRQRDLSLVAKPPRSAAGRAVEWLSRVKERTWR